MAIVISVPAVTMAKVAITAKAHQTHTFPNFWAVVLMFLPPNLHICLVIKWVLDPHQAVNKDNLRGCRVIAS